jgi:hypothetical protein
MSTYNPEQVAKEIAEMFSVSHSESAIRYIQEHLKMAFLTGRNTTKGSQELEKMGVK